MVDTFAGVLASIIFAVLIGLFYQLGQIRRLICNGITKQTNKNSHEIHKILKHLGLQEDEEEPINSDIHNI